MKNKTRSNRRKKRVLKKRIFIIVPLLLVVLLGGSYLLHINSTAESAANEAHDDDTVYTNRKSDLRDVMPDPKFDNVSILMMGVDSGDGDKRDEDDDARTDALMLATLNKNDKSIKMLSIPRDTYAYIPEVGYETKINHAHSFGGPKGTIDTVEDLFGIPIDYYVRVNFNAFMDVVDAVDGIEVDVPYDLSEQDSSDKANAIQLKKGEQELNGEEALAFARTRKMDSDVERGKRQQEVMKALLKKTLSVKSILKYDDVFDSIAKNMKTNMTYKEMKSFFGYLTKGTGIDIENLTIDGVDYQPGSVYYWQLDDRSLAKNVNIMEEHLEIPVTDFGYDFTEDELEGKENTEETNTNNEQDDPVENNNEEIVE